VIEERVSRLAGADVRALRPIKGGGYAASFRALAELADGRTVFVKADAEELTSGFLRDEQRVYAALSGPFMPELVGMDDGEPPLLVLEDLSPGHWPPPWDESSVAAVRETLAAVAATAAPEWLHSIAVEADWLLGGWAVIGDDPEPLLSLGVCSAAWLEHSLPVLREAAETAPIEGDALLHLDVRTTTSAWQSAAPFSSIGTGRIGGIPPSISPSGSHLSHTKVGHGPKSCCPEPAGSLQSSPVFSLREPACRRRPRRRTFAACSSRSCKLPCRGLRRS
jgi:hypothetical protein